MAQVIVFGDSMIFGFWDREGGWVDRLKVNLAAKSLDSNLDNYCPVFNLGIPGDTSQDLLERFEFEINQRKNGFEKRVLIFGIGGNDSQQIISEGMHKVSPETFAMNVSKLIKLAKGYSEKIVFVGPIPVDESRTDPLFWMPDRSYKNDYVVQYNEILQRLTLENGVYFIDLFKSFFTDNYIGFLEDGLHPTSEGHKKILQIVEGYLVTEKII